MPYSAQTTPILATLLVASLTTHFRHSWTETQNGSPTNSTLNTILAIATAALVIGASAFYADYRAWIIFGNGAPPDTCDAVSFTVYRTQQLYLWLVRNDVTDPTNLLMHPDKRRFLHSPLPNRGIARPAMVKWFIPQRTKPPSNRTAEMQAAIPGSLLALSEMLGEDRNAIQLGTSRIEGKGDCVRIHEDIKGINSSIQLMFREIAHIHDHDLSIHALLAPADAAEVLQKGWGEKFALAGRRAWIGRRAGCIHPAGMVFLYPPTTMAEVEIVKKILVAGVKHALAGDA